MSLHVKSGQLPLVLIGAILASLMILSGCESARTPSSAETGDSYDYYLSTPTASPSALSEGGTTVVEVIATDSSSNPVEGLTITFIGSGGTFTPPTDLTDANGIASTIFTPEQTGSLTIGASATGAESKYVNIAVSASGQPSTGNVTISVTPKLLTADDASTASVVVRVKDINDNPATDSTIVKLTAGEKFVDLDGDGYFSNGIDSLVFDYNANEVWDPIGYIPSIAYTEAGSVAVAYTAGGEATTAYIKATVAESGEFDGTAETSIQLTPNAQVTAIELSTESAGIQVRHTGGIENTYLYATCYDINGNKAPEGMQVTFIITDGPGGGENISGQGYGPVTANTNSKGVATVPVWSGTISGTVRLYASAGTVLSNATFVAIYAGPPYYMAIGAAECNIPGWNYVNVSNEIVAVVSDIYKNPVQDSVAVYFTADEGSVDGYNITQDLAGVVKVDFRTGDPMGDGEVWIWAETSGGNVVCSTMFWNSGMPATVGLSISPTSLTANGKSQAFFLAEVLDVNAHFVINGTVVKTLTLFGSASEGTTSDGCHASVYEGKYTSQVLDMDYSMNGVSDDGIGAVEVLTARSGFVQSSVACTLMTSSSYYQNCAITSEATVPYGATGIPVRVVIKDRYGNPLGDHRVVASVSVGTMSVAEAYTNAYGEAFDLRLDAPAAPPPDPDGQIPDTKAIITVVDMDPNYSGDLVLTTNITFTAPQ